MQPPNPYTSTREQWTQTFISIPTPPSPESAPEYIGLFTTLQHLFDVLAHHDAMARNLQQTYMTPAKDKNKIYFMWDFWGRTLGMLFAIDPDLPLPQRDSWIEIKARVNYGLEFMSDTNGKADRMNGAAHPGSYKVKPFGEVVLTAVEKVKEALGDLGEGVNEIS